MINLSRNTKETKINLELEIYGSGKYQIDTGVGFFNHMMESFTKHSLMDLALTCKGDTFVDYHHSVEDCAILLGQALNKAIFPAKKIERFSNVAVVMDEASIECDLDISNRAFLYFDMDAARNGFCGKIGSFDVELVEEFFRALAFNAGFSVHLVLKRGANLHHIVEGCFKALALALRRALAINEAICMPSTKGCL